MSKGISTDVAVIGAGSVGIAVAYYLLKNHGVKNTVLIDPLDPMSLTSAQSGENYRNWWPHPMMTAFTDDSMSLMEDIAVQTDNRINMTRRGYALVTRRKNPQDLIDDLYKGYGTAQSALIRTHETKSHSTYVPPVSADWRTAPEGVDVLLDQTLIRQTFPTFAEDVAAVIHIRRAGSISGQQLGQFMLEAIREAGGQILRGKVIDIQASDPFTLNVDTPSGITPVIAERLVNAAGPFFREVSEMIGESIPVSCVYQQKIAFEDRESAIPRGMPFTIDLDPQQLSWTDEERALLAEDPQAAKLLEMMPGGIHCRPDGAENGKWIKMGWAYNTLRSDPKLEEPVDPQFPDSLLRAGSRLHPGLQSYIGRLPRNAHHYGGYYAMTEENWPLIGPMKTKGAFMAGALSGFGTMGACATGALCAAWMQGGNLPAYGRMFSLERYDNKNFVDDLMSMKEKSVL